MLYGKKRRVFSWVRRVCCVCIEFLKNLQCYALGSQGFWWFIMCHKSPRNHSIWKHVYALWLQTDFSKQRNRLVLRCLINKQVFPRTDKVTIFLTSLPKIETTSWKTSKYTVTFFDWLKIIVTSLNYSTSSDKKSLGQLSQCYAFDWLEIATVTPFMPMKKGTGFEIASFSLQWFSYAVCLLLVLKNDVWRHTC